MFKYHPRKQFTINVFIINFRTKNLPPNQAPWQIRDKNIYPIFLNCLK